jgi:hypothetical protein
MRLSGLALAATLLVSATLLAQHSSGGGSNSGGGSHGSSASSSGSFHGSSTAAPSSARTDQATAASKARTQAPEASVKPEKKGVFSFLWHKKSPVPLTQAHSCAKGAVFNGFNCSSPYMFDDCSALASQLGADRQQMQGQSAPGAALFYRLRLRQYESCMARRTWPYGFWAYNRASLFDAP